MCVENVNDLFIVCTGCIVNGLYEPHQSILSVAMRNSTVNVVGVHS